MNANYVSPAMARLCAVETTQSIIQDLSVARHLRTAGQRRKSNELRKAVFNLAVWREFWNRKAEAEL